MTHHAYPASRVQQGDSTFWLERGEGADVLAIEGADTATLDAFTGTADGGIFRGPATAANAAALRQALPWLAPTTFGLATSAGCGDRIGLCTPGHAAAFIEVGGLRPVFAQQSIREMGRTHRTPTNVLDDAMWGAFKAGWTDGFGADADHLKTLEDIDACADAGYRIFTFDPGFLVDGEAHDADFATCLAKAEALDWELLDSDLASTRARYVGMRVDLEDTRVELDDESVVRAFAKYGASIAHAAVMYRHLAAKGLDTEVEMAVDETDFPTTAAEHVIMVREFQRLGAEFVGLAPRFVGQFEKGVEFIGDLEPLKRDFEVHAQLARALGPYKLSLHSGSDKFSVYPLIAEATGGMVHLKTAGTSWVEALRIVARRDPELMGEILAMSRADFESNRQSYHLSCDLAKVPTTAAPDAYDGLITALDSRQVLHVGYGPALTTYGDRIKSVLRENEAELDDVISKHFVAHLAPFAAVARR